MIVRPAGLLLALAAALLLASPARSAADNVARAVAESGAVDTQLTDELKLADEAFIKAYQDRDLWAMSRLWARDDYVSAIFPAAATPAFSWDNVRRSWQHTFDHNRDIKIKSLAGLIQADSDAEGAVALVISAMQFQSFQTQTGQPIMLPNVLVSKIYERRDGKWLLAHYHAHQPGFTPPTATDEETGSKPVQSNPLPEVKAADARFNEALRELNLDKMGEVWSAAPTITAIQPDGAIPFMGRDNVLESWKTLFEHNRAIDVPDVLPTTVHVAGNKAWVIGTYQFALTRRETGKYTHLPQVMITKLFQHENDRWRLAHYHAHVGPLAHTHGDAEDELPLSRNSELSAVRTIAIDAAEMTFGRDEIEVTPGELIRFVVTNKGDLRHEFSIGTEDENLRMRALMRFMPDMVHNGEHVVTVNPGETKELTWRVPERTDMEFSCNMLGHADAGMHGKFRIKKRQEAP